MAGDRNLHSTIDAEGVQPGLALGEVLEPGALFNDGRREGRREGGRVRCIEESRRPALRIEKRGREGGREGGKEASKQTYPQTLGGENQSCALPQPVPISDVPATQLLQISTGNKELLGRREGVRGSREGRYISFYHRCDAYSPSLPPSLPPFLTLIRCAI
jgi:hypothetical protein